MIILLPTRLRKTGGTSTFAKKLQAGLTDSDHQVIFEYQPTYDVLLASPRAPLAYLLDAKRRHKPIIQRLDGVYYPATTAGSRWRLHNMPLALIKKYFAQQIIYQSEYSKKICEQLLSSSGKQLPATIIYNGVDTQHFNPTGPAKLLRDNPAQQIFITWSRFRRPDQIKPLLQAFAHYQQQQANSKLVLLGNFEGAVTDITDEVSASPGVQYHGVISNKDIPAYARGADVFVMTHQNPPCPNNVLEAMACGLPICGLADGAMPELVADGITGHLLPVTGEGFIKARPINPEEFAQLMKTTIQDAATLGAAARTKAVTMFNLTTMISLYLEVFTKVNQANVSDTQQSQNDPAPHQSLPRAQ